MTAGAVFIPGRPVPQGSTKAFVVKGHAVVTSDNPATKPWRSEVAAIVRESVGPAIAYPTGAVALRMMFLMPRRAAEPKRVTPAHTRKPDLDKLTRAVFDAVSGILVTDDAQFVRIDAEKRTAWIGQQPGLVLSWSPIRGDE
jgi:crossover junction endodeoxyribonuclease RusA